MTTEHHRPKWEKQAKVKKPKVDWGFDLTSFENAAKFQQVLDENGLTHFQRKPTDVGTPYERSHFEWSTPDRSLVLETSNNPITGEYQDPKARAPEVGYASYMGITGTNESAVLNLVNSIKRNASDIKDESPRRRDFV